MLIFSPPNIASMRRPSERSSASALSSSSVRAVTRCFEKSARLDGEPGAALSVAREQVAQVRVFHFGVVLFQRGERLALRE
jgi:hypothetical protein